MAQTTKPARAPAQSCPSLKPTSTTTTTTPTATSLALRGRRARATSARLVCPQGRQQRTYLSKSCCLATVNGLIFCFTGATLGAPASQLGKPGSVGLHLSGAAGRASGFLFVPPAGARAQVVDNNERQQTKRKQRLSAALHAPAPRPGFCPPPQQRARPSLCKPLVFLAPICTFHFPQDAFPPRAPLDSGS